MKFVQLLTHHKSDFRNKLANLYVQILESQSVDKSFAVNNEMSSIAHYDLDKWQDDLVTSIFSNTLSFQRFFISFLLQNIDQIAIGQIFEKINVLILLMDIQYVFYSLLKLVTHMNCYYHCQSYRNILTTMT